MILTRQRALLEQRITSAAHARLFTEMQSRSPALSTVDSWAGVVRLAVSRDCDKSTSDELLLPLVSAHAVQPDQRLIDVLTIAIWSRLVAVFARTRRYDSDPGELWQNIQLGFLQTLQQPSFSSRGDILRRIYFGTLRRVHRLYQKTWQQRPRLQSVDDYLLDTVRSRWDDRCEAVDFRDEQRIHRNRLKDFERRCVIDDIERHLIVATRLEGNTLPAIAGRLGLTPDAAKGRRDRAEQRLAAAGHRVPNLRTPCLA